MRKGGLVVSHMFWNIGEFNIGTGLLSCITIDVAKHSLQSYNHCKNSGNYGKTHYCNSKA